MLARINRSYVPAYWDDFFNDKFFNQLKSTGSGESRPAVNISEDDKGYTIELAVPGVAKEEAEADPQAMLPLRETPAPQIIDASERRSAEPMEPGPKPFT